MSRIQVESRLVKVLHVVQCLQPGGIESMVLTLNEKGAGEVFVLALEGDKQSACNGWPRVEQNKKTLFFLNKKKGFCWQSVTKLRQLIKKHRFDVIHSHHIGPLIYTTLACLPLKNIQQVHTEHDVWHLNSKKNYWLEWLMFKLNKKINHVGVSKIIKQRLNKLFPNNQVSQINNGVDLTIYKPGNKLAIRKKLQLPQKKKIILSAGRLEQVKGHEFLIKAFAKLSDDFFLIIAGDGLLKKALKQLSKTLKVDNRILFTGNVDNLIDYYQASDVFCLPSLNEGLPLVLLEAQASGLAIVCTDVGGCADAIDEKSGVLVSPGDSEALLNGINQVFSVSYQPQLFVEKNYSLNLLLERYNAIYQGQV